MPQKHFVFGAMFDIRPIKEPGVLDFEKIARVATQIHLKPQNVQAVVKRFKPAEKFNFITRLKDKNKKLQSNNQVKSIQNSDDEILKSAPPMLQRETRGLSKEEIAHELEDLMSAPMNVAVEVARFGGRVNFKYPENKVQLIGWDKESVSELFSQAAAVPEFISEAAEAEVVTEELLSSAEEPMVNLDNNTDQLHTIEEFFKKKSSKSVVKQSNFRSFIRRFGLIVLFVGLVLGAFKYFYRSETGVKSNIIQNGKNAISNLVDAKEQLENLQFSEAANSFALAHDDFSKASNTLNKIGAIFSPVLSRIPILDKISGANNLVIAGGTIAKIGQKMALALDSIYQLKSSLLFNEAEPSGISLA